MTCKKILCYMRVSVCRWRIVKTKAKIKLQESSTFCRWLFECAAKILVDFSKTYHHRFLLKP